MSKFIAAYHPVTGGKANFEEQAFEAVWKDLGWVEGEAPEEPEHDEGPHDDGPPAPGEDGDQQPSGKRKS